jgi:hypothetical protein
MAIFHMNTIASVQDARNLEKSAQMLLRQEIDSIWA